MSKTAKIITVIIIVLVVGGGAWWWLSSMNQNAAPASGVAQNGSGAGTALSANGSSNADLNADLSQIDGQMNGFSSDSANINQGMHDQPVDQSQL